MTVPLRVSGGPPAPDDTPTEQTLAGEYRQAAQGEVDQPVIPVPVLLSHLVAYVVAVLLLGVNSAVWALVPGGLAAVLSVVQLLALAGFQGLAARWAHDRSRPVTGTSPGRHAA